MFLANVPNVETMTIESDPAVAVGSDFFFAAALFDLPEKPSLTSRASHLVPKATWDMMRHVNPRRRSHISSAFDVFYHRSPFDLELAMRVFTLVLTLLVSGIVTESAWAGGDECGCAKNACCVVPPRTKQYRLCGPPPPTGPVLESVAIRRVPIARETSFQLRQEAGELSPEREQTCGSERELANAMSQLRQLQDAEVEKRFLKLETELSRVVDLLARQQDLLEKKLSQ